MNFLAASAHLQVTTPTSASARTASACRCSFPASRRDAKEKVAIVEKLGEYKSVYANPYNDQSITVKHSGAHHPSRGNTLGLDFERKRTHLFVDNGRTLAQLAN